MTTQFSEATPHPHVIGWFDVRRIEISNFCTGIVGKIREGINHLLVKAQVKSGKKDIVECLAVLVAPSTKVFYVTALNRKDVKKQVEELALYGVATHLVNNDDAVALVIAAINAEKARGFRVIICLDECDYGSGSGQKMSGMFTVFLNDPAVTKIYFSATAQETEVSILRDRQDFHAMTFVPPPTYFGAEWFLDEGLVFDTDTFFIRDEDDDIVLSEHAKLVIIESMVDNRHIGAVRINGDFNMKDFKRGATKRYLEQQLFDVIPDGKPWEIIPVDATDSHDWEDRKTRNTYVNDEEVNYLFILKQTCSRGTDLKGWHHKLAFWHDARSHHGTSRPNTLIQAFGRPFHYSSSWPAYNNEPQRIRIYCDMVVMELAAYDDMHAYLEAGGKPPARTAKQYGRLIAEISPMTFATEAEARIYGIERSGRAAAFTVHTDNGQPEINYRNSRRPVMTETETRTQVDFNWGAARTSRLMPVFVSNIDHTIRWVVIYNTTQHPVNDEPIKATNKSMYDYE